MSFALAEMVMSGAPELKKKVFQFFFLIVRDDNKPTGHEEAIVPATLTFLSSSKYSQLPN